MRHVILGLFVCAPLFGANQVFVPAANAVKPVSFEISYTAGVHTGTANALTGTLELDGDNRLVKGRFAVPITAMKTRNETRDCHMREALGIDYTHSAFPADHVCNAQNQTPTTGPDSVVYPEIGFEFTDLVQTTGDALPKTLVPNNTYSVFLRGRFSIHGQTRLQDGGDPATTLTAKVTLGTDGALRLQSSFPVVLKDYGIIVKPSKLGPVTIAVGDKATVNLNLVLVPQK